MARLTEDELIKVRARLGMYHSSVGWFKLYEVPDTYPIEGMPKEYYFRIESQGSGQFQSRKESASPIVILDRSTLLHNSGYTFVPEYPELQEFFSKRGEPKTPQTVLIDFLESPEAAPFKPEGVVWKNPAFDVMVRGITKVRGEEPKIKKPFSFKDWLNSND